MFQTWECKILFISVCVSSTNARRGCCGSFGGRVTKNTPCMCAAGAGSAPSAWYKARRRWLRFTALRATLFCTTAAARNTVPVLINFTESNSPRKERPCFITSRTSRVLKRRRLGSIVPLCYTERRLRPFRLLRRIVDLPPAERFRFKNPWTRARFRRFGWYVCDICPVYRIPTFSTTYAHNRRF